MRWDEYFFEIKFNFFRKKDKILIFNKHPTFFFLCYISVYYIIDEVYIELHRWNWAHDWLFETILCGPSVGPASHWLKLDFFSPPFFRILHIILLFKLLKNHMIKKNHVKNKYPLIDLWSIEKYESRNNSLIQIWE